MTSWHSLTFRDERESKIIQPIWRRPWPRISPIQPSPNLSITTMGIASFGFDSVQSQTRTPRLTIRCEYPDTLMAPTEVTFRLSPHYGIYSAREAHDWFLRMMQEHEEFEVETDRRGLPSKDVAHAGGWKDIETTG